MLRLCLLVFVFAWGLAGCASAVDPQLYQRTVPLPAVDLAEVPPEARSGQEPAAVLARVEARLAERARQQLPEDQVQDLAAQAHRRGMLVALAESARSGITITDEELRAAYEARSRLFETPAVAVFDYVFAPVDEGATEATVEQNRARAEQVRDLIATGAPREQWTDRAAELGLQFSRQPLRASPGTYSPEIEEIVFSTAEGEVSSVRRTANGYHAFAVRERRPAQTVRFADARPRLRESLEREKLEAAGESLLQSLRETYPAETAGDRRVRLAEMQPADPLVHVAGETITAGDVNELLSLGAPGAETALEDLEDQARLRAHARERGLEETATFAAVTGILENHLLAAALIDRIQRREYPVTEEELLARFEAEPATYVTRPQWEVVEYSVPLPEEGATRRETFQRIEERREALEQLAQDLGEAGADTERAAQLWQHDWPLEAHDRGLAPMGPRGRVLDMAVREVESGEYSDVVDSSKRLHLFFVIQKMDPVPLSFDEARETVLGHVLNDKRLAARLAAIAAAAGADQVR